MKTKRTKSKLLCTICFLLLLLIVPASATDAMIDRSRTQFGDLTANEINYINSRMVEARADMVLIPDVNVIADYGTGSTSDQDFIDNINSLDETVDMNVVLIHSHGGSDDDNHKSAVQFKDSSWLFANEVDNWLDDINGGFIFMGTCNSTKYADLGWEFLCEDFDSYFGYRGPVFTLHNARFYAAFFDLATFTNVEVCDAADYAEDEVEEEFGNADDVGYNRFLGDDNLCLRT
ncbi:hypothetical protein [Methanolobus profundi]|uniref:DUF4347 domain-containing protein n=1 Tax=Methanolobus profundi TaxID=487685 RepID=A0A1I4P0Y4_9EURY|nr:hypothetical protein [Methanolobus profundi]SFM21432.1 hypothetical protein SAMN04488696_0391 [Methanolobus profundi]